LWLQQRSEHPGETVLTPEAGNLNYSAVREPPISSNSRVLLYGGSVCASQAEPLAEAAAETAAAEAVRAASQA